MFDVDGNGTFDAFELKEALSYSGFALNSASLGAIVRVFASEDGAMSIDGFIRCMAQLKRFACEYNEVCFSPMSGTNTRPC